jgi:hypothetical protein
MHSIRGGRGAGFQKSLKFKGFFDYCIEERFYAVGFGMASRIAANRVKNRAYSMVEGGAKLSRFPWPLGRLKEARS